VDNTNVTGESDQTVAQTSISQTLTNLTNTDQTVVYTVTPTVGTCVGATFIVTVTINPKPVIPAQTPTPAICSGATFTVTPVNAAPTTIVPTGTTYTWTVVDNTNVTGESDQSVSESNISQTLINNDTVPHNVVYHVTPITGSCQGAPFTITITVNPKVIPNELVVNVLCNSFPPLCNGSITLNPTPTGTGNFNYQWNIPGIASSQTNLCSDNYWVKITDSYSCTYKFDYTVTVPPPMISTPSVNPVNNTNCDIPASCNGIIQVVVSGGTPFVSATNPYHFQWFEVIAGSNIPIVNSLTQVNTSILQNLCGGTYLLVVTDSVNCQKQFGPYTITDPAPLVVTSTVSNYNGYEVSCNGGANGTIGINVTGGTGTGITVILNPGPNQKTLPNPATFSGLTAGSYTVVIHDLMNTCPDITRNFVLTQPANPVQATLNVISLAKCHADQSLYGAIPSGGIGGYDYLWSNGETTIFANTIPIGAFNCIITDSNGCPFTLNGTNTPPPLLVATAAVTNPILCFGGTASISVIGSGGTPGYFGDTGTHTGVLAGTSPIYSITDVNGCPASVSIPVSEPPLLQVTAVVTTPITCFGGNAEVTVTAIGGVGGYTGTGTFFVPAGINIPFTVTDANNCSKTVPIDIIQPTQLVATATLTAPILCKGNTGIITISGTGGTPFSSGQFYTGIGPITVIAGTGIYFISDANGCPAQTMPFIVSEPSAVIAIVTINDPIKCNGGTAIIEVTGSGGVLGTGYVGDMGFHPGILAGPSPFYIIKDSNGCQSIPTSIPVVQPGILTATASVTRIIKCNGETGDLDVQVTGGTAPYDYSWSSGSTTADATNLIAGIYSCVITDDNGCLPITTSPITLTQPGVLAFTTISSNPNCYPNRLYDNGSICIKISGGTSPFPIGTGWVQSITNPDEWCRSGLSAGSYTISISDFNNCPATSQPVTLSIPTPPLTASVINNVNVDCNNKEVSQTNIVFANGGVPGYTFSWSGGNACDPVNPQCMTTAVNGSYSVDVNDQEGILLECITVKPQPPVIYVNLPTIGAPVMSISSDSSTTCGIYAVNDPVTLTNISTGDYTSIQWSVDGILIGGPTDDTIIHNFTTIGNHIITLLVTYAIDGVPCIYPVSQTIAITKGYNMVVPTAFTPNGDAWNAFIKPEFNCMQSVEMKVFDTWGSLLYSESGAILTGWDGAFKGKPSENGNYIMNVNATTLYGAVIEYNGPFILIK
jgi:gliding motility-associated-like protein